MNTPGIFSAALNVVNIGLTHFAESLEAQHVKTARVSWSPPANGNVALARFLGSGLQAVADKVADANAKALELLLDADPCWVGIKRVRDVVPGVTDNMVMHSGPPIPWARMASVQKKGIAGAVQHERLAKSEEEAFRLIESGKIDIRSANDMGVAGAGAGIVSPSMVVNISRDKNTGKEAYCVPFEGRVGLGVWGVYNAEVEENLQLIETVLAPAIDKVLGESGGIDIKKIIAQGLQMNDETHTRQTAEGLILVSEIVPLLLRADITRETLIQCVDVFVSSERWFHPLGISSSLAIMKGIADIEYCTVVHTMCGNGVDYGIKVSALGDQWFTAPAPYLTGKYLAPHWSREDAVPWIGDSCIVEACGLGAFSGAAAPAVIRLRGGDYADGILQSEEMKHICIGVNHHYPIPLLGFTGPGIGIDIVKVGMTGITPLNHGGIISKEGGQIGAGIVRLPFDCFEDAIQAFAGKYGLPMHDESNGAR
jgi:hypothetical protein